MRDQRVVVTEDHLKLLRRTYIQWDDSAYDGAPCVGLKRPYGNSDVMGDVAEILGWWEYDEERDDEMPVDVEERCETIHREMEAVLQVLVQNPCDFGVGTWVNTSPHAPYGVLYTLETQ